MSPQDLTLALLRTTLVTSAAACLAALLLAWLKIDSPRTHRIAWLLVILQGWLLIPWTLQIETAPTPNVGGVSDADFAPPLIIVGGVSDADSTIHLPPPSAPGAMPSSSWVCSAAMVAWLLGAAALTLFAAYRYARILRTLPRGEAPDDPDWQRQWQRELVKSECHALVRVGMLNLKRFMPTKTRACHPEKLTSHPTIDFRITAALGPLVAFIPWRYLILAPRPLWTELTKPQRAAILRHELAHIRRRDLWKSLAFRLLALPQWFNPLVWLAARRFDEAAEWSCDDSACRRSAGADGLARNSTTLANSLLRTAELTTTQAPPPRAAGFIPAVPRAKHRSALTRRIQRLVTPRFKEESTMKRLAIPALLATIAAAQLIRIEHVAAQNPPPSEGGAWGGIPAASSDPNGDQAQGGSLDSDVGIPTPASDRNANELSVHDVITVLVDYTSRMSSEGDAKGETRDVSSFQIACEITEIRPNGNLAIEGRQTIRTNNQQHQIALSGEVRPEAISSHRTVGSRSIVNLNINKAVGAITAGARRTGVIHVEIGGDHDTRSTPLSNGIMDLRELKASERRLAASSLFHADDPDADGKRPKITLNVPEATSSEVAAAPSTADTQAILAEARAAREARDPDRETAALFRLPYVVEVPDILEIKYSGGAIDPSATVIIDGKAVKAGEADFQIDPKFLTGSKRCLVEADGRIHLSRVNAVSVAGLTIEQARAAIAPHLGADRGVQVTVDVAQNNSKVYYIITKHPEGGDDVVRAPITGNETVIDAIANLGGISEVRGVKLWIDRPAYEGVGDQQILPIAWSEIADDGDAKTNYRLRPGDKLYIDQSQVEVSQPAENIVGRNANSAMPQPIVVYIYDAGNVTSVQGKPYSIHRIDLPGSGAPEVTLAKILHRPEFAEKLRHGIAVLELRYRTPNGRHEFISLTYDPAAGDSNGDGQRQLRPGDRIYVTPMPQRVPGFYRPSGDRYARAPKVPATPQQIEYDVTILEDASGALTELLESDHSGAVRDSNALLPAIHVLAKHKLVKYLADPHLRSEVDRPAEFTIGEEIPGADRLLRAAKKVKIVGHHAGTGPDGRTLIIDLEAYAARDGKKYDLTSGFTIREGQTAIARMRRPDGSKDTPLWVVVTPEWIE